MGIPKYCIQLLHFQGGSKTIIQESPEACKVSARNTCAHFKGSYIFASVPFPVYDRRGVNLYDCSLPQEIKDFIGPELTNKYLQLD